MPGPGAYNIGGISFSKPGGPKFTMGKKRPLPGSQIITPGPGHYNPEHARSAPAITLLGKPKGGPRKINSIPGIKFIIHQNTKLSIIL